MYDELIKRLRECVSGECWNCSQHKDSYDGQRTCADNLMKQAADAIEELSAIREEQKAQIIAMAAEDKPRWIPVTERLPKEGEFVLVHGNLYPNKHDGGVIAVSKRMDWNYWQGFGRERNITHWMPLPEPPKEET